MKTAIRRIQQLVIGGITVLSLAASSIAACTCSRHVAENAESEKSCHSHSHSHSHSTSDNHGTPAVGGHRGRTVSETGCSCTQASPRLALKQDKKHLTLKPAIARSPLADPHGTATIVSISVDNFGTPPLSQSYLRNSIQGRAPPRPKFA